MLSAGTKGCTEFPQSELPSQNSKRQNGDRKQVSSLTTDKCLAPSRYIQSPWRSGRRDLCTS